MREARSGLLIEKYSPYAFSGLVKLYIVDATLNAAPTISRRTTLSSLPVMRNSILTSSVSMPAPSRMLS